VLEKHTDRGLIRLKIVETEAYHQDDPASHTYNGQTLRTAPMFEAGGRLYVYFTYGMHYCLNIVTGRKGVGEAVLIRAAEPLEGLELIRSNRGRGSDELTSLTNGPGKLAQALGINSTNLSGKLIGPTTIDLQPADSPVNPKKIIVTSRVGITKAMDNPWRFYLAGNKFVSKL
jgi:DNA-3-methyladenine glycosylase